MLLNKYLLDSNSFTVIFVSSIQYKASIHLFFVFETFFLNESGKDSKVKFLTSVILFLFI
jgi:hypothetical protein